MTSIDLTGYKLTFDDEFNTRSISQTGVGTTWADIRSEWRYDTNSDIGFGHSSFVDSASGYDPFSVQGGALSITAVPDQTKYGYPGSWESGLITTQGNFSQTYGYFEMRADLADAKGGWDAFWLLPDKPAANPTNLPGWQELDVVEHYGANNKGVYSTIHTTDQTPNIPWQQNRQVYSETAQTGGYHTYGMDWQKDKISFYVDGQFVGSQATPSDMNGPMYLLANLATQSDADAAGTPMTMKIDYIRAYSNAPTAVAIAQGTVSAPDGQDPGLYGATALNSPAPVKTVAAATPFTASIGTGSDTLVLKLSQDAYNGDALYTVSVDGKQVGGTLTAHASHASGQFDTITVNGDWATGDHKVSLNFLNDAYSGTAATDRNLYLDSATYNGAAVAGSKLSLMSSGAQTVTVHDTTPVPTPATLASQVPATTTSTTAVAVTQQIVFAPDGKDPGLYGAQPVATASPPASSTTVETVTSDATTSTVVSPTTPSTIVEAVASDAIASATVAVSPTASSTTVGTVASDTVTSAAASSTTAETVKSDPTDTVAVSQVDSSAIVKTVDPHGTATFTFKLTDAHFSFADGHDVVIGTDGSVTDVTKAYTVVFADGSIDTSPNASLVDKLYYNASQQDVWSSHVDAATHYNQFGWHEGRDPNADFSTSGYLAANSDVAKAGINPLTHYDQNGWKEGRDPSAHFDNELYLLNNPDVKASGMDPLSHYLQYGKAEGRQAYDAIGKAASFTHGSFDAEYYLLANPDVAKAALASGGDTFAFAYQHYEASGWTEGRKADAYFDPAYYLAHNPDVAAAHIDPLTHYDLFGWKEGRDPSVAFDTSAYLAANPDVAAAHIDPLTHYLQFGAAEGRHLA